MGIKHFRGVFSRNNLPAGHPSKNECGIINLDDSVGPGTHWVSYVGKNYFDPFGLPPPKEVINYIPGVKYNNIQYQDKTSVLCGYYCLFFINLLQSGIPLYNVLYRVLSINNSHQNEQTIIYYFST